MTDLTPQQSTMESLAAEMPLPKPEELTDYEHLKNDFPKLAFALPPIKPMSWMHAYVDRTKPEHLGNLPDSFQHFYQLVQDDHEATEQIKSAFTVITQIANLNPKIMSTELVQQCKELYKLAEMRVMHFVKEKLTQYLPIDPETQQIDRSKVLNVIALNGALVFEPGFSEFGESKRVEFKRMERTNGTFQVAVGKDFEALLNMSPEEKARIEVIILPDDCISTGMSQATSIELLFRAGFNPKKIIIPATVAVGGGLHYLQEKALEFFPRAQLVLAAGEVCHAVNNIMYLQTLDGKFMVGDMGFWGRAGNLSEVPNGKSPLNTQALNEVESINEETSVEDLKNLSGRLFSPQLEA